ncbi:UNVERIFIED_ORG: hypothetical protein M2348_001067 [Sphingomonas sp. R1F5B]
MAVPMKGQATFLDAEGQQRTVQIDMAALLSAEDETGAGLVELAQTQRVGWLASLLRHGLASAGEDLLTREAAAELLLTGSDVRVAILAAFEAAMPKPSAGGKAPAAKPKTSSRAARTGTRS